jgi:T4 RnlA family RNA ligase
MFQIMTEQALIDATVSKFKEFRCKQLVVDRGIYRVYVAMVNAPGLYDDPLAREARGIVFNTNGELVSRPLHKFFNYGENSFSDHRAVASKKIACILPKRDGSMVHQVATPDGYFLKTKKAGPGEFKGLDDVARWVGERPGYDTLFMTASKRGLTVVCEWTSAKNRIVVDYREDRLTVLHVRENDTGRYYSRSELAQFVSPFGEIYVVQEEFPVTTTFDELTSWAKTATETEGVVVMFEDGDMVKIKTAWYLALHHTLTSMTPRDVFDCMINETLDDVKSELYTNGRADDLARIVAAEVEITAALRAVEQNIETAWEIGRSVSAQIAAADRRGRYELTVKEVSAKLPSKSYLWIALAAYDSDRTVTMEDFFEETLKKLQFRRGLGYNSICGFSGDD